MSMFDEAAFHEKAHRDDFRNMLIWGANELAKREGIADKGYRLVINSGAEAGQEVPHLHLHLLGGRAPRLRLREQ